MYSLQRHLFGNTIQDWIISLAIFTASVLMARYVHPVLLQAVFRITGRARMHLGENRVNRVCTLITWAVPIMGFTLARSRLVLDEELSLWISNGLLISGQILFLLIILDIFPALARIASDRHLGRLARGKPEYLQEQAQSVEAITKRMRGLSSALLILIPLLTILSRLDLIPVAIWALPFIVVLMKLIACYRIIADAKRKLTKGSAHAEITTGEDDPDARARHTVVKCFLKLFRHQLRVSEETPSEFSLLDPKPFSSHYVYELRVQVGSDFRSRRMTVAPLGEESGSGSRCFYVIYDDHLVIKIPRAHIADASQYVESLRKEAHIVEKLAMKECVVPRASVILKKVHTFPDAGHLAPEELEERYIKWLGVFPGAAKYLKIGDDFAFFMDFSKYYFLQHILEYIHDTQGKMYEEILTDAVIIWDVPTLENKYGPEKVTPFIEVGKVCAEYETETKQLLVKRNLSSSVSEHQIKRWFFIYLALGKATELERDLGPTFIADLNARLEKLIDSHSETIENYRATVKKYVSDKNFVQNKPSMEGLVTNLVELLARLRDRGVAIRDLKPDNLLVAGDPRKYPAFLSRSNEYEIGLIDVETAVILDTSEVRKTGQPPVGGTPHYATPSHFFENEVLRNTFQDLTDIFYLQDWHALIVIIYKVITGEYLFEKTVQLLPGMVEIVERSSGSAEGLSDVMENVSEMFWGQALAEFRHKVSEKEDLLMSVKPVIPETAKKMFREYLLEEKREVAKAIKECVMSQSLLGSDKNRQYVLSCSHEKISRLIKKYASGAEAQASQQTERAKLTAFLEGLAELKLRLEEQRRVAGLLTQSARRISAYDLLELMFHIVLTHMYRHEWKPLLRG